MAFHDGLSPGSCADRSPKTGRFTSGNRAYRSRHARIAEKLNALRQTYDGRSPGDMALLAMAAQHLCDADIAKTKLARTRATNSALRVLREVRRRPELPPSVDEVLRGVAR